MATRPEPFLAGQRLTAGQLNDAVEKMLDSVTVGVAGGLGNTSGTTELNISQLALGPVAVDTANQYKLNLRMIGSQSVGTDEYFARVRRDTALTGALVAEWAMYAPGTTAGFLFTSWSDFVPAVTNPAVSYFFSVVRGSGSGSLTVWGQLNTQNRSGISISRAGYAPQFRIVT